MDWFRTYRLRRYLKKHFKLRADSLHGPSHWQRVEEVGLQLAKQTKADKDIVRLFSVLHDACRENEYFDDLHGERAAALALQLQGTYYTLKEAD